MINEFAIGSLEYIDALFEASNDAIILLDENYKIKKSNCALKKNFPASSASKSLESSFSLLIGQESYFRLFKPTLDACLEKGKKATISKWTEYHKKKRFFQWTFHPVPTEHGFRQNILAIAKDLTELQNLKDVILQKDMELKSLIHSDTDYVFFLDTSMHVFDTNNQGFLFAKANSNNSFHQGDHVTTFIPERVYVVLKQIVNEIACKAKEIKKQKYYTKFDKHFEFTFKPIRELTGNVVGTVVMVSDITVEKVAEQEMHLSRNKLKALFDSSIQSIFLIGKELEVLEFNKRASDSINKIWNKTLSIGDNVGDYFFDAIHDQFTIGFKSALTGKKSVIEQEINYPNGLKIWSEITFVPVYDMNGEIFGVSFSTLDITERKLVEAKLRENEANLTSLIENNNTLIWAVDRSYKLILFNSHFRKFFDYTFNVTLSPGMGVMDCLNEDTREYFKAQFDKVFEGKSVREDYEIQLPTGKFVAEIIINPIISEGEIIGASILSMNIADRKFREVELEQINNSYRQEIDIRKTIEEDLKFKNNELDTFIYKASHDLRGPIASLMGLYNAATIEIKDPKSLEYLEYINKTAQRMDQVLKALINLSDIKDRALSLERTNLREIVADIMRILENKNLVKDIEFKINIPDISINTDAGLVMVIIKNLLENAIRYSRLDIKSVIELDIEVKNDDSLQISIRDNGLGIPNQIQDKVFNMFFKGNNLSSGSGLGLYMVKTATFKLGGKVSLNSTVNSGTSVQIILPPLRS